LQRAGFTIDGHLRDHYHFDGALHDAYELSCALEPSGARACADKVVLLMASAWRRVATLAVSRCRQLLQSTSLAGAGASAPKTQ
jgi:hypothetical protein